MEDPVQHTTHYNIAFKDDITSIEGFETKREEEWTVFTTERFPVQLKNFDDTWDVVRLPGCSNALFREALETIETAVGSKIIDIQVYFHAFTQRLRDFVTPTSTIYMNGFTVLVNQDAMTVTITSQTCCLEQARRVFAEVDKLLS